MKFTVYSDIHHHTWSTGVSLEDTLAVEEEITAFAKQNKDDFVLFCGDRFESRNPHDEIKCEVDKRIIERNECGIPSFYLVGNHDQWYRRLDSGHSMRNLMLFNNALDNVVVMDRRDTYYDESGVLPIRFHAWPAEMALDMSVYEIDPADLNLFVFHSLLDGTMLDLNGFSISGMDPAMIDNPGFDFVFGGDAHIPQKIDFKNTKGGYVGSTLQHTRRDIGDDRGWVHVEAYQTSGVWEIHTEFVKSTSPSFIELHLDPPYTDMGIIAKQLSDRALLEWDSVLQDNILILRLKGQRDELDSVTEFWKKDLQEKTNVRKISLIKEPDIETVWEIQGIEGEGNSPEKDLKLYIESGLVNLEGLKPEELMSRARVVFEEV